VPVTVYYENRSDFSHEAPSAPERVRSGVASVHDQSEWRRREVKKSEVAKFSPEACLQLANKVAYELLDANQFRIALQHGRDAYPSALQPAAK
jgi:hypothetical protein